LHEGLPSSSFRSFSDSCAELDDAESTARRTDDRSGSDLREEGQRRSASTAEQSAQPVVVGGAKRLFLSAESHSGESAPQALPTSGRLAAPTSGVPLPDASPAAGLKPAHENQVKSTEQERYDRSDAIVDAAERRRIERQTPVLVIFREAKAILDQLQREYKAWDAVSWSERDRLKLPEGAAIENALKTNAEHRREFAEMYRTLGRDVTLAKWRDFLINEDHLVTSRDEGEIERIYLMAHFSQLNGVSTSRGES
jgi:hypothetical protein